MTRTAFSLLLVASLFSLSCTPTDKTDLDKGADDSTADSTGTDTDPGVGDEDGDGYTPSDGDCDDSNPAVNPGTAEICDGVDNNCDGDIDENADELFYA